MTGMERNIVTLPCKAEIVPACDCAHCLTRGLKVTGTHYMPELSVRMELELELGHGGGECRSLGCFEQHKNDFA